MATKNKIDPNLLFKVGAAVAGYFVIIKPLLEFLGLKSSKDDQAADENIQNFKGWNPLYYKQVSDANLNTIYFKTAVAEEIAKRIEDAWSWINDNEEQVYSNLRLVKNQVQLSQIAHRYYLLFNTDLVRDAKTRLSDTEFNEVVKIVSKLPLR